MPVNAHQYKILGLGSSINYTDTKTSLDSKNAADKTSHVSACSFSGAGRQGSIDSAFEELKPYIVTYVPYR